MPFDANEGSDESQDNVERRVLHGYAAAARVDFNVKPPRGPAGGVRHAFP